MINADPGVQLSMTHVEQRLRRNSEPPDDVAQIIAAWRAPHKEKWTGLPADFNDDRAGIEVVFRRERSGALIEAVRHARLEAVVLRQGIIAGAMAFDEYSITRMVSDLEFFDELDGYSSSTAAQAEAILVNWSARALSRLPRCRRIVCFDRLWVKLEPGAARIWQAAARAIIERHYERRYGMMILCPFPLEYEGAGEAIGAARDALEHRVTAMARLYARHLHVTPLPGQADPDRAFMWRPLRSDVPRPKARQLRVA